ncbi:MAG: hypothetical protein NVSMB55_15690 [Mycobacteriales bacterium]
MLLLALWGGVWVAAARRWAQGRSVHRRDRQLMALLAGVVVPPPRRALDDQRAATTNSTNDAACRPVAGSRTR